MQCCVLIFTSDFRHFIIVLFFKVKNRKTLYENGSKISWRGECVFGTALQNERPGRVLHGPGDTLIQMCFDVHLVANVLISAFDSRFPQSWSSRKHPPALGEDFHRIQNTRAHWKSVHHGKAQAEAQDGQCYKPIRLQLSWWQSASWGDFYCSWIF